MAAVPPDVIEFGECYPDLVKALQRASAAAGCRVRGFHEMTITECSTRCPFSTGDAAAARRREYDEPFEILDLGRTGDLLKAIERQGRRWTRGDVYYHITGRNDKARAVRMLTSLYRRAHGQVWTLGQGDGLNDAAFLKAVDRPFVVRSRFAVHVKKAVPHACVTHACGPQGWSSAVMSACGPECAGAASR